VRKPKQEIYAYDARVALWLSRDPIEENGGLNLYNFVGNEPISRWDYLGKDWHHLLPKSLFGELSITGVDIHSAEYGWDLPQEYHTRTGGVHPSGWNADWKRWIASMKGKEIRKCDIDKHLKDVMWPKYKGMLDKGKAATGRWPGERSYAAKLRARGSGVAAVLMFATVVANEASGANAENAHNLQVALEEYQRVQHLGNDNYQVQAAISKGSLAIKDLFSVPDAIVLAPFYIE